MHTDGYRTTLSRHGARTRPDPDARGAQHERTAHMEAPPREPRARAAFFREKEARRVAKKQRKKERLLAKVAQAAKAAEIAPPPPQTYSSGK